MSKIAAISAANEIKCPHCGTVFTIDELEYSNIVQQVRTLEFESELHARLAEAEKAKQTEIELAEAKLAQKLQKDAAEKDAEIERLKAEIDFAGTAKELAEAKIAQQTQKAAAEKDAHIASLKAELDKAATLQTSQSPRLSQPRRRSSARPRICWRYRRRNTSSRMPHSASRTPRSLPSRTISSSATRT